MGSEHGRPYLACCNWEELVFQKYNLILFFLAGVANSRCIFQMFYSAQTSYGAQTRPEGGIWPRALADSHRSRRMRRSSSPPSGPVGLGCGARGAVLVVPVWSSVYKGEELDYVRLGPAFCKVCLKKPRRLKNVLFGRVWQTCIYGLTHSWPQTGLTRACWQLCL